MQTCKKYLLVQVLILFLCLAACGGGSSKTAAENNTDTSVSDIADDPSAIEEPSPTDDGSGQNADDDQAANDDENADSGDDEGGNNPDLPPLPVDLPPQVAFDQVNPRFCPEYLDSELLRPRASKVVVDPSMDWELAVVSAPEDSEVVFKPGYYQMRADALWVNSNITLRGETGNPNDVIIVGEGYDSNGEGFMIGGEKVTIAELSMTNIRTHAFSIKSEADAHAPIIYRVHIYDIGTKMLHVNHDAESDGSAEGVVACSVFEYTSPDKIKGDFVGAIDLEQGKNWTIRDNYIANIFGDGSGCEVDEACGFYDQAQPAILLREASLGAVVERNILINNYRNIVFGLAAGYEGGSATHNFIYRAAEGNSGIELNGASNILIAHNTVYVERSTEALAVGGGVGIRLYNNFLSSESISDHGGSAYIAHSNLFSLVPQDLKEAFDYHLMGDSRAIGACQVIPELAQDIEGDAYAERCDVGADYVAE